VLRMRPKARCLRVRLCELHGAGTNLTLVLRAVRADSALFFPVPGHEDSELEDVVGQAEGYQIVRKRPGAPQQIAEAPDPRSN
jgi:hypothetical protein